MLAGFRTDEVPVYFKQRQVNKVQYDFYKPKPVFKNFVRDTPEIMAACMSNDSKCLNIQKICEYREEEERVIVKQIAINYQLIKDIYTLLQSRSRAYPFVDTFTFRQYFVRKLGLLDEDFYKVSNFDVLLNQVMSNNKDITLDGVRVPKGSFCRYQFLELTIRMGKFLFSTGYMYRKGGRQNYSLDEGNHDEVSVQRSLFVFIEEYLKPYYEKVRRDFAEFREEKLWDPEVEVVFTMNEQGVNAIYKLYSEMN